MSVKARRVQHKSWRFMAAPTTLSGLYAHSRAIGTRIFPSSCTIRTQTAWQVYRSSERDGTLGPGLHRWG